MKTPVETRAARLTKGENMSRYEAFVSMLPGARLRRELVDEVNKLHNICAGQRREIQLQRDKIVQLQAQVRKMTTQEHSTDRAVRNWNSLVDHIMSSADLPEFEYDD